ncbi:RND transporter [Burkholderia ubonensis]|nr:RND transporter [Burkholderia ubonensis]KVG77498.1 RND transporter [Burkholderia ubonensis]KVH15517.1 RND transporter [Burkholderia ubonensis]KVH53389.1 RND transporter [Burkholderia ubonensis]KVH82052.1 RND transporter [Burkholderia ubonensis]
MNSTIRNRARQFIRRRKWPMCGLILVFAAASPILAYHAWPSTPQPDERWVPVQPQLLENHLGLVGSIDAASRITITAPFDGLIEHISVAEGQKLTVGQRILTLDTTQLDLQVRDALAAQLAARRAVRDMEDWSHSEEVMRARRAVTRSQLELGDTATKLAETRRLFDRGIVARTEVDALEQQARTQRLDLTASQADLQAALNKGQGESRKIAEMQLANAESRYRVLQAQRAQREILAPFPGLVLRPRKIDGSGSIPPAQQGMRVAQGTPLFDLIGLDRIKAITRVEEVDLHQLREGMPVQVSGDGFADTTLQGHIASIGVQGVSPEPSGGSATYEVAVLIDPLTPAQQQQVRLGMSAQLKVATYRAEHGLAVPAEALRQDDAGRTFVAYRKNMTKAPEFVHVTTGRTVPQGIEIFGLAPGYVALPGGAS